MEDDPKQSETAEEPTGPLARGQRFAQRLRNRTPVTGADLEERFDENLRRRRLSAPTLTRAAAVLVLLGSAGVLAGVQSNAEDKANAELNQLYQEQSALSAELDGISREQETVIAPENVQEVIAQARGKADELAEIQTNLAEEDPNRVEEIQKLSDSAKPLLDPDSLSGDFNAAGPWFTVSGGQDQDVPEYQWRVTATDVNPAGDVRVLWWAVPEESSDTLAWVMADWQKDRGVFSQLVRGVTTQGKEYEEKALAGTFGDGPDQGNEPPSQAHLDRSRAAASSAAAAASSSASSSASSLPADPGATPSPSGTQNSPSGSPKPSESAKPSLPALPSVAEPTGSYGSDFVPPRDQTVTGEESDQ